MLVHACGIDEYPPIPALVDYFGNVVGDAEKEGVVLGVYQGMINHKKPRCGYSP